MNEALPQTDSIASRKCGNCGSADLQRRREQPNASAGCIVALLGLLLAPVLIGIPIIIYGIRMQSKTEDWMLCCNCGARLPSQAGEG